MTKIINLVRVRQNTHGELQPINHEFCPRYKEEGVKYICWSENETCIGVKEGSVIKELGNMKFLLECRYRHK